MRSKVILCLRTAWTVAALIVLLVGPNVCSSLETACGASDDLLSFMFVLTFPFGTICLLFSTIIVGLAGDLYPSSFFVWWLMLAIGGSFQWLIVVPELISDSTPITLDLKTIVALSPMPQPAPAGLRSAPPIPAVPTVETITAAPSPVRNRAKAPARKPKRVRPFDGRGRTPLERVIHRL